MIEFAFILFKVNFIKTPNEDVQVVLASIKSDCWNVLINISDLRNEMQLKFNLQKIKKK